MFYKPAGPGDTSSAQTRGADVREIDGANDRTRLCTAV